MAISAGLLTRHAQNHGDRLNSTEAIREILEDIESALESRKQPYLSELQRALEALSEAAFQANKSLLWAKKDPSESKAAHEIYLEESGRAESKASAINVSPKGEKVSGLRSLASRARKASE
jgi:hypothetical protein